MSNYKVKYYPDPFLKVVAADEHDMDKAKEVSEKLFKAMYADKGIGLAATQCGVDSRIFVMDTKQVNEEGVSKAFINPVILEKEGTMICPEGCLSFPGMMITLERAQKIKVEHMLLTGEKEELILEGLNAMCFQHELDHLNGVVIFDHLKKVKRQIAERKLQREVKRKRKFDKKKALAERKETKQ